MQVIAAGLDICAAELPTGMLFNTGVAASADPHITCPPHLVQCTVANCDVCNGSPGACTACSYGFYVTGKKTCSQVSRLPAAVAVHAAHWLALVCTGS